MNWYIAKIIFNIDVNQGENQKQFDEQLRLISANDKQEAYFKASVIGKNEETNFQSNHQKNIFWKFLDVIELHQVSEMKDGMEVYSSTHETNEPENFIYHTKLKAEFLSSQFLTTSFVN